MHGSYMFDFFTQKNAFVIHTCGAGISSHFSSSDCVLARGWGAIYTSVPQLMGTGVLSSLGLLRINL